MKKLVAILLCATIGISVMGCEDKKEPENGAGTASKYESALDVLTTVADAYAEDQKFPMAGGDSENMSTEGPAAFDISKTEELTVSLTLPESEIKHIDDAASLVHMMNANIFTGAAYHLTDDADMKDFSKAVEESVLSKQWICGMPDTLVILKADDEYVVTAYGEAEIMETFKENAEASLDGSEVILETSVSGN